MRKRTALVAALALGASLFSAATASAEIHISQTASPAAVPKGGLVTLTITIRNETSAPEPGAVEMFSLTAFGGRPVDDPYESVSSTMGTCQLAPVNGYKAVKCDPGSPLAPGAELRITAVVRLNFTMHHDVFSTNYSKPSEIGVGVSAPPTLRGSAPVKLRGLPTGCVTGDFKLTISTATPGAIGLGAELELGTGSNGYELVWRHSSRGTHTAVTVPVSRILSPQVGKLYTLHVVVRRRGEPPLARLVGLEVCSQTAGAG
jgi:hypothetical protein